MIFAMGSKILPELFEKVSIGVLSMPSGFLEVGRRDFYPVSVPGLTSEGRDAMNSALKAMANWRNEIVDINEKNGKRVIEKMAAVATALGWPEQIVEGVRSQLQSTVEMPIKSLDRMIDVWEEQVKSPNAMTASPSTILSKLSSLGNVAPAESWTNLEAFQKAAMNPLQFWMQFAEQCQKSWTQTMSFWGKTSLH
jgi:hypothetical protein